MTWVVHSKWLERHFNGTQALDLDGIGADTIRLGIVTESVINADTNNLYTGLTAVATGTSWTGPLTLANIGMGLDGSFDLVFDADDPAQINADAGGFTNGRSLVLYENTNSYILAHHTEASAIDITTQPLLIQFSSAGVFKVNI